MIENDDRHAQMFIDDEKGCLVIAITTILLGFVSVGALFYLLMI